RRLKTECGGTTRPPPRSAVKVSSAVSRPCPTLTRVAPGVKAQSASAAVSPPAVRAECRQGRPGGTSCTRRPESAAVNDRYCNNSALTREAPRVLNPSRYVGEVTHTASAGAAGG